MPPRRCICQHADPTSPIPAGRDGCVPQVVSVRPPIDRLTRQEIRAAIEASEPHRSIGLREVLRQAALGGPLEDSTPRPALPPPPARATEPLRDYLRQEMS
jgi:hypothetical protein